MEIKNPYQIEYESLTNPIFLWIMGGCSIVPIILIILKATVIPNLSIILLVFGIIVLPSGLLFGINGIRLIYGIRIKEWINNGIRNGKLFVIRMVNQIRKTWKNHFT